MKTRYKSVKEMQDDTFKCETCGSTYHVHFKCRYDPPGRNRCEGCVMGLEKAFSAENAVTRATAEVAESHVAKLINDSTRRKMMNLIHAGEDLTSVLVQVITSRAIYLFDKGMAPYIKEIEDEIEDLEIQKGLETFMKLYKADPSFRRSVVTVKGNIIMFNDEFHRWITKFDETGARPPRETPSDEELKRSVRLFSAMCNMFRRIKEVESLKPGDPFYDEIVGPIRKEREERRKPSQKS